jgi:hypothetical protein
VPTADEIRALLATGPVPLRRWPSAAGGAAFASWAMIVWLRWCDEPPRTLQATADALGWKRERVRQAEAKALHLLRHPARRAAVRRIVPAGCRLRRVLYGYTDDDDADA